MRPHRVILKDDADIAFFGRNVDTLFCAEHTCVADVDFALFRFNKSAETADERRFTAAGRSHDAEDLAFVHRERKILEYRVSSVSECNGIEFYLSHIRTD